MRRRDVVAGVGVLGIWSGRAAAQLLALPTIGVLRTTSARTSEPLVAALGKGLKDAGLIEGQNFTLELRFAENQVDRLPSLVAELVARRVAVIVADNIAALALKAATPSVPIVAVTAGDPVRNGLVASLSHPGGNVTAVSFLGGSLGTKRLELLRDLVPAGTLLAVLGSPDTPTAQPEQSDIESAADRLGQPLLILGAANEREIDTAFATMVERGAGALLVGAGALLYARKDQIVSLAARHRLPAIYVQREFAEAGGLMSYGASIVDAYRQAGVYAGRIVNGEKPGDLPVVRSTTFEFVINLKAATALGLRVPERILALADEVNE